LTQLILLRIHFYFFKKDQHVSPYLQLNSSLYTAQEAVESIIEQEKKQIEHQEQSFELVPPHCIPIRTNVLQLDWKKLGQFAQFDVITMDPPWQLASANPTRGVAIGYSQLSDKQIEDELKLHEIQKEGFLFIWVINAKYVRTLEMIKKWGYKFIDDISWVKRTVNRRLAKGHGYYLQHAKETCLVAVKGNPKYNKDKPLSDVIFAERRGQSQKPEEIYELIEQLVPNGKYLEIFGRKNNLRNYWVTIGNEL